MSKSKGNVVQTRDFVNQYHPEILKFIILSVHYRSEINFEKNQIFQAIARLSRIYKTLKESKLLQDNNATPSNEFNQLLEESEKKFTDGLNDDCNTPIAFAAMFELIRQFNHEITTKKKKNSQLKAAAYHTHKWITTKGELFSLFQEDPTQFLRDCDQILLKEKNIDESQITTLIEQRNIARKNKDFKSADIVRQNTDLDILFKILRKAHIGKSTKIFNDRSKQNIIL